MPTLEYVFGCLRQEALTIASVIIAATRRLGLVSLDDESTRHSEWGSRHSEKARIVNSNLSFDFSRFVWLRQRVHAAASKVFAATS